MKIGLNATCFNDRPSGAKQRFIGVYGKLFKNLSNDEFIVYEPSDCRMSDWFDTTENVVFRKTPLPSHARIHKYLRGLYYWPSCLKSEKLDVFEGFNLPLVKPPTGRSMLTIHDIRGMLASSHWRERIAYGAILKQSMMMVDHVVTVSKTVRNEILDYYPNTQISVIYNGVNIDAFKNIPDLELQRVRQDIALPEEYLLAVGHFEKRKNYLNLIDAVARLHRAGRQIHLVIVGNDSGEVVKVKERALSLGLSNYVKILSGLTNKEVRCIYKLCKLFVFPSLYEGFGIPVLEAMAACRPMVLSNIPVFEEITQGQGAYFSPHDPTSIASIIDGVLSSANERDRLVQYGNERVQDFSFTRVSQELASVYRSVVQGHC